MAHWIIKGSLYECSNCCATFNDYFRDMGEEVTCPCCGAPINEEENQHGHQKMQNL